MTVREHRTIDRFARPRTECSRVVGPSRFIASDGSFAGSQRISHDNCVTTHAPRKPKKKAPSKYLLCVNWGTSNGIGFRFRWAMVTLFPLSLTTVKFLLFFFESFDSEMNVDWVFMDRRVLSESYSWLLEWFFKCKFVVKTDGFTIWAKFFGVMGVIWISGRIHFPVCRWRMKVLI